MKCQDFREIIDSYLSDELLTETNHDVLRHLEQCAVCRKTIESRRMFRERLRFAVINAPEFQMRGEFYENLRGDLKRSFLPEKQKKPVFWMNTNSWVAAAACLLFAFGFGVWFFQSADEIASPPEIVRVDEPKQPVYFEKVALGNHLNCAVNFNLAETPVEIDLAASEYADLRRGVLMPLQNVEEEYEFVESHACKYQNQDFTHIVFKHEGKLVSVLMMNSPEYKSLDNKDIIKSAADGYQIAHFDVTDKAFFVVSDLPESENSATAEIVKTPLQKQFSDARQAGLISHINFRR